MPIEDWKKRRVVVVDDNGWLCLAEEPVSPEFVTAHVDVFVGSGVDTLCWNLGLTGAYRYPTRVETTYGEGTEVLGSPMGWKFKHNFLSLLEEGHDMLGLALDRGREVGIKVYPSLRVSDAQMGGDFDPFSRAHPEMRIGCQPTVGYGAERNIPNYPEQLDFAHPEVAARVPKVVDELLEIYDLQGLELDFNRRPHFFKPQEAVKNQQIMTDLLRRVHSSIQDAAGLLGHPIELLVRVPPVMEDCWNLGLDVRKWLAEGLMDVLIPGSYMWLGLDLPVEPFVQAASGTETAILVGLVPRLSAAVGGLFAGRPAWMPDSGVTLEMYRAAMDVYYHRGVQGVEIFNFYTDVRYGAKLEIGHLGEIGYPGKVRAGTRVYPYMTIESLQKPVTLGPRPKDIRLASGEVPTGATKLTLEVYVSHLTLLDHLAFSLNGKMIEGRREWSMPDQTAGLQPQLPLQSGKSAYKYVFHLSSEDMQAGQNILTVTLAKKNPQVRIEITVEGVFLNVEMPRQSQFTEGV